MESSLGNGATFHFTARLLIRQAAAPSLRRAETEDLEGLRVLVVDDNTVNRRILQGMLTNWRMEPSLVASGAEALTEMLKAAREGQPFPLVLLDGMMPGMDGFSVAEEIRDHPELSGGTIMMLSSTMASGAAARCAGLGVASHLTKPVSQGELLDAILVAIGRSGGRESAQPEPAVSEQANLHILLAEDNAINRKLAAGILEKRGHSLVYATNGPDAVAAAAREVFDLILMDVQMPEMDGFEAARLIRESEKVSGRHVPIAAVTAYAMAGDRERCLAAGMDDYISKPLQKAELLALLKRTAVRGNRTTTGPTSAIFKAADSPAVSGNSLPRAPSIFSRKELLDQVDEDVALMGKLIALFQQNTPRLLDEMRGSIAHGISIDLARSAHTLLGSLGVFGARQAGRLTQQLETQARTESFEGSEVTFTELEREMEAVSLALEELASCGSEAD